MNRYQSTALALLLLVAAVAVLWQLPLIVSVPILLIWPFVSLGNLVVDGYARFFAGLGLALFAGWRIVVMLPMYLGPSGLVEYGQYMMEAQFMAIVVLFAVALGLAYAGVRSLRKPRVAREQPA